MNTLNECVINGKIKRKDVVSWVFNTYREPYGYCFGGIRLLSEDYKEYLTNDSVDKINSKELKGAINEIYKHKKEWEKDYNSKVKYLAEKEKEIDNKTWVDRLIYLFLGKL